tara:strand:+ start:465 stop:1979 length:1515 start_codon:yes stop_codon:yes gene_type:complete
MTRGEKVCKFIENYCLVPEGKKVGQPLRLMDFQRQFILDIYDNPKGTARAYLSIARKNGKTALIAAIMLVHLVGPEAKLNSQVASGARSRKQAALVFKLAEKMIRLSPKLSKIIKITPSKNQLIGLPMNVEYQAISAEAGTAHGLSPILAILDEVGQVRGPTDSFIEAIETSQGAHDDPVLIAISTQAATDGDLFSIWLDDAKNAKDPRTVCHLYTAAEDCEVLDKEQWKAANPALGVFRGYKDLEDFAKSADRLPAKENSFRWLYLNQRIEGTSVFLNKKEWASGSEVFKPEIGATCYAALDLSSSRDLTAFIMTFPDDKRRGVVAHFFMPSDGIMERSKEDKVPYDLWAKAGYITLIDGPVIDPAFVAQHILEAVADYDLQILAYDRWRIDDFKREINNLGGVLPLHPFGQGFKDMAPAVDTLERLVAEGNLLHGDNPVLTMCAANAKTERDPAGNRKLTKSKSIGRIDGLVALAMALGAETHEAKTTPISPWEDPAFTIMN